MCGIAGFVNRHERADPRLAEKQVQTLLHRGPDAWGVFDHGRAAIGQTRLSIIDLDTGDPPITNEDGTVGVALNGEIYNYRSLRERLLAAGHQLATAGDTEVIAHLAEELDPVELAMALDGMFAFAVWDTRRGRLLLGRDRFGKKPLYYWKGPDTFVFGSELKALFVHPDVPRDLDEAAIGPYLTFGYVPSPRTFFQDVVSLPPGHVMTVTCEGTVSIESYFRLELPGRGCDVLDVSLDEAAREARRLFTESVHKRLVSDVPIGAFLSGGVDSSAVVGVMSELMSEPVRTFTIGFEDEDGFDERPYARIAAERFKTEHTEFVVKPEAVDLLEKLVYHYDQPFGDSSSIPTYLLSELTSRHVTVALCGDGGDELFAGYERFAAGVAAARWAKLPRLLRSGAQGAAGRFPAASFGGRAGKVQRFLMRASLGLPDGFRSWIDYVPVEIRDSLGVDDAWGVEDYRIKWAESSRAPVLTRLLELNIRTYLLDDLLPKVDRMAMAHGLEVRSPFLDHELATFALSLPPHLNLRGLDLKRTFKRAVRDLLPNEILQREKHGFGVPLDRWFRHDLRGLVESQLFGLHSRVSERLDRGALRELWSQHLNGASHGHAMWTLMTLEIFLRTI